MAVLSSGGILSWNISSIRKRENELRHILNLYQPAIALIQETHLYPGIFSPSFQGYTVLRADRQTGKGGGVAILISDQIAYKPVNLPNITHTEAIAVTVPANGAGVAVVSLYVPPSKGRYKELRAIMGRLGQFYISAGDFNTHNLIWGGQKTNQTGQYLEKLMLHLDCRLHLPPSHTRTHPNDPSKDAILDLCFTHSNLTDIEIEVLQEGSSDHKPILISLPENFTMVSPKNIKLVTDWDGIAGDLGKVVWPTIVEAKKDNIDKAVKILTANIQAAMLNNTKGTNLKNKYRFLVPKPILKLIKRKRKLKHKFLTHRSSDLKLKQISRKIRKALQQWELERKMEKIKELDDPAKRWKILRDWSPKPPKIPTLKVANNSYYTNKDKADILASCLHEKHTEHPSDPRYSIENEVNNFRIPNVDENVPEMDPSQVSEAIDAGKSNKAPGYDGICYKILKLLNIEAIKFITKLFNSITRLQYFPDALKLGIITVLPKEGKPPDSPSSYRPITLLPTLGKIYEYCLLSNLRIIEKRLNVIPNEQHGFRAAHSTGTQLARVSENLIRNYNQRKATVMVALDIEAAFDKVPLKYLLYKLHCLSFPNWTIRLLSSYFTNRQCRVKVDDELSEPFVLRAGTPQGGILSPFLYSLYTADIPLRSQDTFIALYADDTLLMASNVDPVVAELSCNIALTELEIWLRKWKIKANGSKSKVLFISQKSQNFKPEIFVANKLIELSDEIKY